MKKQELKSHIINGELLTEEQKKLFWAERMIEKFKEYDRKRTEYVHRIEQDYQVLRKRYDELEAELYGNGSGSLSKGERKRRSKVAAYNRIMRGEHALQVIQEKYMIDGNYTPEFQAFLRDYKAAAEKEQRERLEEKNKKLTKDNENLLCQLVKCRERIRELEQSDNNS
ncbi:hypothetical protein [Prevotella pallens]|uniref:hypothetical protein n=1 Tax=Prevotella pallens TaxID=60133 RepID=UPI0028EDAD90|nr:hypothetical protein [Prevotella pallens]